VSVVLVDWLGRGGIAQCTETWAFEYERAGRMPTVVTRSGRPLSQTPFRTETGDDVSGKLRSHAQVARTAAVVVRAERPDAVVVQNYVVPALEWPLYQAVREVGARLILVIHDHQLHSASSGMRLGLRRIVRRADVVLAHTEFVAAEVARWSGRGVDVIPHPLQLGMLVHQGKGWPFNPQPDDRVALHFGILRRRYKGSGVVMSLADRGVPGWQFALIGVGAPSPQSGVFTHDAFVSDETIVRAVRSSAAVLLPYRRASQSGAVVLAQALGSVVVASAVGGIPEQVVHGSTGLLVERDAPASHWVSSLERLLDDAERVRITSAARDAVTQQHERFRTAILGLVP
jgi:glycosyltransferase involved in cell wall biosynthesis